MLHSETGDHCLCPIGACIRQFGSPPSLVSLAAAQSSEPRQFAVTIKHRKVTSATNVISVTKGDAVEIVLTGDEAAELHLRL